MEPAPGDARVFARERAFDEAQARREATAAALVAARSRASAALAESVRAHLVPRFEAIRDALLRVGDVLDALDVQVRDLEARGITLQGLVPAFHPAAATRPS